MMLCYKSIMKKDIYYPKRSSYTINIILRTIRGNSKTVLNVFMKSTNFVRVGESLSLCSLASGRPILFRKRASWRITTLFSRNMNEYSSESSPNMWG